MTRITCPGTMYSGSTLEVHRQADADFYEHTSAVCDTCKQRLTLLRGRRLPKHWLEVTIHRAVAVDTLP